MRFSTLALFIVLPATAYAAATPQTSDNGKSQPNTNAGSNGAKVNGANPVDPGSCIQQTVTCVIDSPSPNCCSGLECKLNSNGAPQCLPPPASSK